jgi:hypothetical protein
MDRVSSCGEPGWAARQRSPMWSLRLVHIHVGDIGVRCCRGPALSRLGRPSPCRNPSTTRPLRKRRPTALPRTDIHCRQPFHVKRCPRAGGRARPSSPGPCRSRHRRPGPPSAGARSPSRPATRRPRADRACRMVAQLQGLVRRDRGLRHNDRHGMVEPRGTLRPWTPQWLSWRAGPASSARAGHEPPSPRRCANGGRRPPAVHCRQHPETLSTGETPRARPSSPGPCRSRGRRPGPPSAGARSPSCPATR